MTTKHEDMSLPPGGLVQPRLSDPAAVAPQPALPAGDSFAIDENLVGQLANAMYLGDSQSGSSTAAAGMGTSPVGKMPDQTPAHPDLPAVPGDVSQFPASAAPVHPGSDITPSAATLPVSGASGVERNLAASPENAVTGVPVMNSATPGMTVPGAPASHPASMNAPSGNNTTGIPVIADAPPFVLPSELNLIPEPRDLHKQAGAPGLPEGIEHDTEATKPYWLAAREAGIDAEASIQPIRILPIETELKPTQLVENLPNPPKRPPPQPPSKAWITEKLTAMSGQDFIEGKKEEKNSGPYWIPSNSGVKHGDKGQASTQPPGFFDVNSVRKDFPILQQKVNGKPLVWLDNAATTQKPWAVINRISKFYQEENSNVHRAAHELAARSTDAYETARERMRKFLGAGSTEEIVFTRGTTESINLVAQSWGRDNLRPGDEIIVSEMEHHSNIVPWQHICKETGARIKVAPFLNNGEMDLAAYERLFSKKTRLVAITQVSNALGTVNPVQSMVATAHRHDALALVDGAQSTPHFPVNVQEIGADFFVLSSHKIFGPTGVGVLFGKKHLLEEMPPWQGGGNMIADVTFEETRYNPPPFKFEAGTAILAGAVGMGEATAYLERIGFANAARYEEELLHYAQDKLAALKGVTMIGTAKHKAGVLSFVSDVVTPGEMGEILNNEGIAVRTGHHCAQPALRHFGLEQTIRPSIAFYNTRDEIDLLVDTVKKAISARK